MSRRPPLLPAAAAALAAAGLWPLAAAWAADRTVTTTADNTFVPSTVTVNAGDTVTWVNQGGVNHTVTATSPNWSKDDTIALPGASTAYTFRRAGTYTYVCQTHAPTMRGSVVVRAVATASPAPTSSPTRPPRPSASATPLPTRSPAGPSTSPTASPAESAEPSDEPAPIAAAPRTPSAAATASRRPPVATPSANPGDDTLVLGEGGLTRHEPTGRGRGLPVLLAVIAAGGVLSAQVRTLLSVRPSTDA